MKRTYIVYDGRAAESTGEASVLEAFESNDDNAAMREARELWSEQGAWLYAYDEDGQNLINERRVGFVDDYETFPSKRRQKARR